MANIVVRVAVLPAVTLVRPSDEPPGQLAPASQDRSSHTSSPGPPASIVPHAMALRSTCSRMVRPNSVVGGTGCASPTAWPLSVRSQTTSHTTG